MNPVRLSIRTSECIDEVTNLKRVDGLGRDLSGLRFGKTLRSGLAKTSCTTSAQAREGRRHESARPDRRTENPEEEKTQEGTELPDGEQSPGRATDFQGEQGPEAESAALRLREKKDRRG